MRQSDRPCGAWLLSTDCCGCVWIRGGPEIRSQEQYIPPRINRKPCGSCVKRDISIVLKICQKIRKFVEYAYVTSELGVFMFIAVFVTSGEMFPATDFWTKVYQQICRLAYLLCLYPPGVVFLPSGKVG